MTKLLISFILICFTISANAQYADTTERNKNFTRSNAFQIASVGSVLIIGSIVLRNESIHIRSLRNNYLPDFKYQYDNYTQYLPAAALVVMKASGVKSRSSWGRMLVSDAFSAGLMTAAVNIMKQSISVRRPDGSANNSYPSGHTATAFMTATMFSKEYGHRSKWYSVGAYSIATITGLTRMLNNRHWITDGMCGAGIGIITTELGYFFADLIFKDKWLNFKPIQEQYYMNYKPSFLGLSLGFSFIPGVYHAYNGKEITFNTGADATVEGAWFITKNIGVGARLSAANISMQYSGNTQQHTENNQPAIDVLGMQGGAYFSFPLTPRWAVGTKLLAGINYTPSNNLNLYELGEKSVFAITTGASITYRCKQYLGLKLFTNYTGQKSPLIFSDKLMHMLTLGGSVQIQL